VLLALVIDQSILSPGLTKLYHSFTVERTVNGRS
jgi:hypothetical protein